MDVIMDVIMVDFKEVRKYSSANNGATLRDAVDTYGKGNILLAYNYEELNGVVGWRVGLSIQDGRIYKDSVPTLTSSYGVPMILIKERV